MILTKSGQVYCYDHIDEEFYHKQGLECILEIDSNLNKFAALDNINNVYVWDSNDNRERIDRSMKLDMEIDKLKQRANVTFKNLSIGNDFGHVLDQ